jgi:glycosyltransferase involved in cell wall biosynthesis
LAQELMVEDRVDFLGWRSPQEIPALLKQSHVGVIPHVVSNFWNHTIPNKLFDYMLHGLPVLCTQASPVQRIIEAERCGVIVSQQPEEVVRTVMELKNDLESLQEMGRRGRQAVLDRYNWEQDSVVFLQSLEKVVEGKIRQGCM